MALNEHVENSKPWEKSAESPKASGHLPLDGIRVVDVSQVAAGPYGTSLLADFGADIIKVEPIEGDSMRHTDEGFGPGQSAYFFGVNRNKRSVALDLKSRAGYDALTKLVAGVDVFVIAYRPDAVRKLGLSYDDLKTINPRLIYVSITAFGETGPRANQPGMDILAQALSGFMGVTGEVGGGPVKGGAPIADFMSSFQLGFGVSAALRLRELTGVGEHISINLLDGLLSAFANYVTAVDRKGLEVRRQGGAHPQLVPYQPFLDSEGNYFVLACLNDKFWEILLGILDEYGDFHDETYATNWSRVAHRDELCARLQEVFKQQPATFWLERFEQAGVPCGPINDLRSAFEDPQVVANEAVKVLEHPVHGGYRVLDNPIRFAGTRTGAKGYAPSLGEHTEEVLGEIGYSPQQISDFLAEGVAGSTSLREQQGR